MEPLTAAAMLERVFQLVVGRIAPEPVAFYKPLASGDGRAMKVQLRLHPTFKGAGGKQYVEGVEGGLFVDIASQGGRNDAGNAIFKWTEPSKVTAKLGIADVSALLVAQQHYRSTGATPEGVRGKDRSKTDLVNLFHQTPGGGTTGIVVQFNPAGLGIRLSKSRELWQSIKLNLQEELILMRMLQLSLDAFIQLGVV